MRVTQLGHAIKVEPLSCLRYDADIDDTHLLRRTRQRLLLQDPIIAVAMIGS